MPVYNNPKFLFLDEPTANLDGLSSKKLSNLLLHYSKSKCFIIASHDKSFDNISSSIINL